MCWPTFASDSAATTLRRINSVTAISLLATIEELAPTLTGPDARQSLERLDVELAEILAALTWFIDQKRFDEALRLANGLYRFWLTQRRFEEGAQWFGKVLESGEGDETLRGRTYLYAGFMPFWMGDDERATVLFTQSLEIARSIGDAQLTSQALGGLSRVALRTDVAEGRRLAHQALEISTAAGDELGRSNALHLLGVGAQIAGDLAEARDWMTQRLSMVRASGNEFLVASEAANLSMVERQLGNLDRAEELEREALAIGQRIGDEFTKPFAIAGLAAIALERRIYQRSAMLLGAAEALMESHKMEWPPDERPHYEHMLDELPKAMGEDEFEEARAVGRALPADGAVAMAMDDQQVPSR